MLLKRLSSKAGLSPTEFLTQNLPSNAPGLTVWPSVLPGAAPFRCHNDLVLTRDYVRTLCAKRAEPGKDCLCIVNNLRTLPASNVRLVDEPIITFVSKSMNALRIPQNLETR